MSTRKVSSILRQQKKLTNTRKMPQNQIISVPVAVPVGCQRGHGRSALICFSRGVQHVGIASCVSPSSPTPWAPGGSSTYEKKTPMSLYYTSYTKHRHVKFDSFNCLTREKCLFCNSKTVKLVLNPFPLPARSQIKICPDFPL